MDLRWRLVAYLSGFALALLVVACLVVGLALREDVAEELAASTRLTELLLTVSRARDEGREDLAQLLAGGQLRHVAVSVEGPGAWHAPQSSSGGILDLIAAWLPVDPQDVPARRIALGGEQVLVIQADPRSEIREILRDALRMLATLLAFSLATIGVAWYAAHRALSPVRALEEGLARLARGESQAVLPRFELKEFDRIAAAIDRLAASLAQSRAAERLLARRLLDLQESERRELARELHDEFGQSLTAIGVAAAFVERHAADAAPGALVECARDIRTEAARVSSHVRGLLNQLRPYGLEGLGMVDALAEMIDGWRQRATGIEVSAHLPDRLPTLGPAAGLALYRTLQEALTNVLRHSGARQVTVAVEVEDDAVQLVVADDGQGRVETMRPGGGLLGMRERAAMAGAELTLDNTKGGGIQVKLRLPIDASEEVQDDPHPVVG